MADEKDILSGAKMRLLWHGDGKGYSVNGYAFPDFPRLELHRRHTRGAKRFEDTWYLDGENVGSRVNAIAGMLAVPAPETPPKPIAVEEAYGVKDQGD